jgi:hypothetical protein
MPSILVSRRFALIGLGVAAIALAGCNTPQSMGAAGAAPAAALPSGYKISNIVVDAGPVVAQSGNPTAQWVQDSLPRALAHAFAAHMAPGAPGGATLSVTVNSVYLGNGGPANPDIMTGVATLSGGGVEPRTKTLSAPATYFASPVDQTLVEQSMHNRVKALSRAYAGWLVRAWRH